MKPLTVYKASAGSGKTFTLAVEYIKLLIDDPYCFKNILAVTFTNKATEEMKLRILSQLYGIWKHLPDSASYTNAVCGSLGITAAQASRQAGTALVNLVHNYHYFRVETIDSFFQSILRNLARELDLTANLKIGLNDIQVEEKAVDKLIDELDTSSAILQWLISYIFSNINQDKSWNVIGQIKSFGKTIFKDYEYKDEFIEPLLKNYVFLNSGLTILYNGKKFYSRRGLVDLLNENMTTEPLYPIIHLKGEDIEAVITHSNQYGEEYYSFVNGQHTTQGGTHLSAFKEAVGRVIKEYYNKNFEYADIRAGIVAAISIKVEEPVFESQTKTKLGSKDMGPEGPTVSKFINDFMKKELDNYLHKDAETSEILLKKIQDSEKERKAIAGVTKLARERAKKANLHNKKLRDCRIHLNDAKGQNVEETSIFITEGDSASGSITKSRDPNYQAVFSLRGKPLNSYGLTKKIVYENEEFNLLQAALNIEDGLDGLRYNKVIIATDADVDGMHIRLLLITFFLQFFPDLIKQKHVYILQTPLFRVRNKQRTIYCYSEEEKQNAIKELGKNPEITRFKGLGEISPDEFRHFIGKDIRLDQVSMKKEDAVKEMLEFYMGKNTMERQGFIIDNLVIEEDIIEN